MKRFGKFWSSCASPTGLGLPVSLLAALFLVCPALAQYTAPYIAITGSMSSSNGMPAQNYGLNFHPTQTMFVGGTSVVVADSNCATDTNGAVVGIRNPLSGPTVNPNLSTGTVPAGNYYVQFTWYDSYTHQTLASPEVQVQLSVTGSIVVSPPQAPFNAIGMDVYIGSTSGGETYQGQTVSTFASYTQSTPLAAGAAEPFMNGSVCQVVANDAAWPIAGYNATLTNPTGQTVPGFPQQWQFIGPGSTYNLSNGLPIYNGRVTYPVPILTTPYNHNAQSISSNLNLTNYQIVNIGRLGVGTTIPGWGVDVEGTGLGGYINAFSGYLLGGQAPPANTCLGSTDGVAFDASIPCLTAGSAFYQTVAANGTALKQEPKLNLIAGANTTISCADNGGLTRTDCTITTPANLAPNPNVPTVTFQGSAAGTPSGNDSAGVVNISAGGSGSCGSGFTVTFGGSYASPMYCVISPSTGNWIVSSIPGVSFFVVQNCGSATTPNVAYLCHQ